MTGRRDVTEVEVQRFAVSNPDAEIRSQFIWHDMTDDERAQAVAAVTHEMNRLALTVEQWLPLSILLQEGDRLGIHIILFPKNFISPNDKEVAIKARAALKEITDTLDLVGELQGLS